MYNKRTKSHPFSCSTIYCVYGLRKLRRDGCSSFTRWCLWTKGTLNGTTFKCSPIHYSTNTMGAHLHTGSVSRTIRFFSQQRFCLDSNLVCSKLQLTKTLLTLTSTRSHLNEAEIWSKCDLIACDEPSTCDASFWPFLQSKHAFLHIHLVSWCIQVCIYELRRCSNPFFNSKMSNNVHQLCLCLNLWRCNYYALYHNCGVYYATSL